VAIAETGWPAEPVTAPYPVDILATAAWQAAYVRRLLGDMGQLNGVAQRSSSSNRTDVSVRSSRYFTMTGAYSERPISRPGPELTGRLPGTTTAPAGISSGWSPSRR
jgi:hypothetical protein